MIRKAEISVYKLLKEDGRQSELHEIVEYVISTMISLNVVLIILESISLDIKYSPAVRTLRTVFFIFFLTEYILRVWIADIVMHGKKHPILSRIQYMLTPWAIVDLMALLPVLLGGTIIDFRIFRVLRLLKITQLKSVRRYTDILVRVLKLKGGQMLSSLFIVLVFMLMFGVIIYDLEHRAQPEIFENVLSGLWWSITAFTTIGYGDMYPITAAGRLLGSCMSIFGVFLMAIPIGILTSGFFEIAKADNEKAKADKDKEKDDN